MPVLVAVVLLSLPVRTIADEAGWQRAGLAGHKVRALALGADFASLAALTLGSRDGSPLWIRGAHGWTRPSVDLPASILAVAPAPDGGFLLGTARDISERPGIFWLGATFDSLRRLYDAQAIGALAAAPGSAGPVIYGAGAPYGDRDAGSQLLRYDPTSQAWSTVLHGNLTCGELPSYFRQVLVAPGHAATVVAVEGCVAPGARLAQLWRSDDGGQRWGVLPVVGSGEAISAAEIDPNDSAVMYLARATPTADSYAGIERSGDGGQTWTVLGDTTVGLVDVRALAVDPRDSRRVIAGTDGSGVFVSGNHGEAWQALPGLEDLRIWSLAIDQSNALLYAATSDGIWRLPLP